MDQLQACQEQNLSPVFVRTLCHSFSNPMALREGDNEWRHDPQKVEYIQRLVAAILESRRISACYNLVLLLVLLLLAIWHWRESRRDVRKWERLKRPAESTETASALAVSSSSSSSTLMGTATPLDATKDHDVERVPLLAGSRETRSPNQRRTAVSRVVRSWLTRQPPPLPLISRTLPPNGTSLFILAWLLLNVFLHLFRLPLDKDYFFIFADRAGCVFIVNLPLLYLLGAKNQPLRHLTGYSYEALNIFHRRVGELLCFEAAVHFVSMLLWEFVLSPEWLLASRSAREYFTHPLVLCGIGALVAYELLYFTSLATFRQRWYELFLATHVLLQAAALLFLWFHFHTSQPYVALALAIFLTDRLVWRLNLKRAEFTADVRVLDEDTLLLSADWDILPTSPTTSHRWWQPNPPFLHRRYSILHGWNPTDHVFLTVPALGRTHALQAHPFTIASAAPGRLHEYTTETSQPHDITNPTATLPRSRGRHQRTKHAWLTLLIRAHSPTGFTRALLRHAASVSSWPCRLTVQLDGPYGSLHALGMLRASGCAVLVAGGSGIAVVWPLVWALMHEEEEDDDGQGDSDDCVFNDNINNDNNDDNNNDGNDTGAKWGSVRNRNRGRPSRQRRRVHLLWVTHERGHREWVPGLMLEELVERGLELVVPQPTAEAGRPDVAGMVSSWIEGAAAMTEGNEVGVVVSGPDGLNRAVRNTCADAIGRGSRVRVAVEKFGW